MIKTPSEILNKFEKSTENLDYGNVILKLEVKQGKCRYLVVREESILPMLPNEKEGEMSIRQ